MPEYHAQYVATLIAAEMLDSATVAAAQGIISGAGGALGRMEWLEPGLVADIYFDGDREACNQRLAPLRDIIDIAVQPVANRRKMMLISDMDSTMITVECIDELADYAGIKAEIAAVTERAMQGELDFVEALRARVALLKGLDESAIAACLAERVRHMPGAQTLVRTMADWGAHTVLISGGFTRFAQPVAAQLGFAEAIANELEIIDAKLTGDVIGEIVDAQVKRATLVARALERGLSTGQVLAVGDGANDIPMIKAAGLGVAYHAKPKAAQAADFAVQHSDLTALLYAQGVPRSQWTSV